MKAVVNVGDVVVVVMIVAVTWSGLMGKSEGQLIKSPQPMFRHDLQHTGRSPYSAVGGGTSVSLKWNYTTVSQISSSPVIGPDGTVYMAAFGSQVYALEGASGNLLWSFTTGNQIDSSPAIGKDGTVFVGSVDGKMYALD